MKNKIGIFMLLFLLITTVTLFGETAATVNLIRDEIISVEELNSKVAQYRAEAAKAGSTVPITPLEVLDVMINDKLVLQGASRDGYMVNDVQVESLLKQQKEYLTQQTGQNITDAQFELAIKQSYGMTLTEFKKALKESTTVDNYVKATQSSILTNIAEPTEAQINEFYRANRAEFINPELVRLSHIFMPFTPETKASVKKEMDTVARFLRYNTYTFEELVPKYSKDAESVVKGGDIGWLAYDDENMKAALGADFFEKVFELNLGKPSGVLESKAGYHIVKITTHTDPKLLSITDRINPDSNTTVKQYIRQVLLNRSQQNAYLKAIDTLVASLRDEATIDILYKGEN
jgi:parvulin-like peptidyl-prolyl isomerase